MDVEQTELLLYTVLHYVKHYAIFERSDVALCLTTCYCSTVLHWMISLKTFYKMNENYVYHGKCFLSIEMY